MREFEYYNPTRIVFGKGTIARLRDLVPPGERVLVTYGHGSIRQNGVYDQVRSALVGWPVSEFGGIEPNPTYETLMQAVELCRDEGIGFLLAVGGGSVLDGTKFIAAAAHYNDGDPWDLLANRGRVAAAIPLATVLTLPATGSESNAGAIISRKETREKLLFGHELVRPRFAILDPETTFTLPERQTVNGIVDAFVHVVEQYVTFDVNSPLQDRQAEGLLLTLIEEAPKVLANPRDYDARANLMWCCTQALNGLIACGVPQDWAAHMIGHELTALWGLDHARSLAVTLPGVWRLERERKRDKLVQYGARVWGITDGSPDERADAAIERTVAFFHSLGVKTAPAEHEIPVEGFVEVADRLAARGMKLGEHGRIGHDEVVAVLGLCR